MSKGTAVRMLGTLVLLIGISSYCYSQDTVAHSVRIMFYNVENLFDIYNDSLTDDDEFLPQGTRRWTYSRYLKKLNAVYKAIISSGEWEPPSLIGLCETENRKVLSDLINLTNLSKFNYGIIHQDSPDRRGIDVCLLYRRDHVVIDTFSYFSLALKDDDEFFTRNILYTRCLLLQDTVHLFINHWPSRRGGVLASEPQRKMVAGLLKGKIDSLSGIYGIGDNYIAMGDFNASPADDVILEVTGLYRSGLEMVNLSSSLARSTGTYRYQGNWETIDQIIVSSGLTRGTGKLMTSPELLKIHNDEFLMTNDPVYPGKSPFSTWRGYRYQGGFSDHFPVLLELRGNSFIRGE